jgi:hypothetical protein
MAKSKRKTTGDNTDNALRKHLIYLLRGRGAHLSADAAFRNLPHKARGIRPPGAQHSLWELLEHMRIAQWDILDFCRNPNYEHLDFPQGYWPKTPAPPEPRGLGQEPASLPRRLEGHGKTGGKP